VLVDVLIGIAVALALLWAGQRAFIYFPMSNVPSPAAAGLPHAQVVTFDTVDGLTLEGWFVPPVRPGSGHTLMVFNGNAGHRGDRAYLAAQLSARGIAVFLVDYRGYGGNPGLPSEEGLARDARAALAYVGRRYDVDLSRIAFFGESLGAAVAVRLALEYPPAALILRSPFSSLTAIGQHHYPFLPVRWLLRDRYPSIDRIAHVTCPVLVMVGDEDRVIPPADSALLYDAARHPKRLVTIAGADHNDEELLAGPVLIRSITDLLEGAP
jgi:hypothetical protein